MLFFFFLWHQFVVFFIPLSSSFRLKHCLFCGRGYTGSKLSNNIECEIFQVLLEEAKESYPEEIVVALRSDTVEDITRNAASLTDWVRSWQPKAWSQWHLCLHPLEDIGSSVMMFPWKWFLVEPNSFLLFLLFNLNVLGNRMWVKILSTYHLSNLCEILMNATSFLPSHGSLQLILLHDWLQWTLNFLELCWYLDLLKGAKNEDNGFSRDGKDYCWYRN